MREGNHGSVQAHTGAAGVLQRVLSKPESIRGGCRELEQALAPVSLVHHFVKYANVFRGTRSLTVAALNGIARVGKRYFDGLAK